MYNELDYEACRSAVVEVITLVFTLNCALLRVLTYTYLKLQLQIVYCARYVQ